MESFVRSYTYPKAIFQEDKNLVLLSSQSAQGAYHLQTKRFCPKSHKTTLWQNFTEDYTFSEMQRIRIPNLNHTKIEPPLQTIHTPCKKTHKEILTQFYRQNLKKVVIARQTTLKFKKNLNLTTLLQNALSNRSGGHFFALILSPYEAFYGVSPETLFFLENNTLTTEALAGTRVKGSTKELFCPKELLEFNLTRDAIIRDLKPHSHLINYNKNISTKKTVNLEHLYTKIHAKLKQGVSTKKILEVLHPTPALGGTPKAEALEFIYNNEPFDRGHYAAPFSLTYGKQTHCLVAIRSALLKSNQLHIFAGSGCVKGSLAKSEWQEIEDKCAPFFTQFAFTKDNV